MKEILIFLAMIALTLVIATSCDGLTDPMVPDDDSTEGTGAGDTSGEETDDKNDENEENENAPGTEDDEITEDVFSPNEDGVIFSPTVDVSIIKSSDKKYAFISTLTDIIYALTGKFAVVNSDTDFAMSKEIVIGETSRHVTRQAKNAYSREYSTVCSEYEKKGLETKYLAGFVIYSDGDSVALYWSDDAVMQVAFDYFVNKYLQKDTLCLEKGYADVMLVDTLELIKSDEEATREEWYDKITEMYGEEASEAVRTHLAMFDKDYYLWLADLYDPGAYDAYGNPMGGGFYYSNSARDSTGFGIDIESTAQALSFLTSAGLLQNSKKIKEIFPEKMQKEMVAFALSCQSSVDGYFYHPQWGKNVQVSRISRDLGNAIWILEMMGEIPYWDTPNNVKGSLGAPGAVSAVSALTLPIAESSVEAVSKVLLAGTVNWTGSAHLATISAWTSYLEALTSDIRTNSYSIGNTVGSQSSQIVARDKMAVESGELPDSDENGIADGGYIETFERIFNGLQLSNGLWEECSVEDGTVYYNAINGLMKISSAYNGIGVKFNRIEEALRAAAFMVTFIGESEDGSDWADSKGKKPNGSVDVYNPWVAINTLLKNATNYYTEAESDALRESIIKPNALEMIKVTTRKIRKFEKADGSYGYTWTSSPSTSQGAPASVPGSIEGDVNGGGIAFTGTFSNMANALGFGGLKPFGNSDIYEFLDRASSRIHIIKDASASFDGDIVGEAPSEMTFSGNKGSATVVDDPRDGVLGNVLSFTTVAQNGCSVGFKKPDANPSKSGICLEWEMAFTDINVGSTAAFQIKLGSCYMFVLGVDTNGKLTISDSSSTNGSVATTNKISATFDARAWNRFRIEFYVTNASSKTTAAKVYLNDELVFVSNTYVGKESSKTPTLVYKEASFYALNATDFTVQFDNVKAYDLVKKYQAETPKYAN